MATTVENPFDTQPAKPTGGLIAGQFAQANPTSADAMPYSVGTTAPAAPNVATYSPTTRGIDKQTGTVQGQVDSILAKDSPLMQRARTLATQQMAQRGLVNSSMAAGAGTAAMIDRATPIAQQDANAYNQAAADNQNALNTSGQFNAGEINRFGLQKGEQQFQASQADISRKFQTSERVGSQQFTSGLEVAKQNFTAAQAQLDRAQQTALADKSIKAQEALQVAQQNFQGAQAALDRTQQSTLQAGQQTFQASQAALDRGQQMTVLQAQQNFQGAQAALDRALSASQQDKSLAAQQALQAAQFNFQGAQAALDRAQQKSLQVGQQEFQAAQQKIQNDFSMRVQELQESGQDFRQARDIASREAMTKLAEMGVQNRFDQEIALKDKQFNIEQYNLDKRQLISNQNELDKLGLQIKASTAQIPTTFAANISNTAMNGVNAIMADGNLNADSKKAAIDNIVKYANAQIDWASKFYATTIPAISAPN